ncbi:MAG: Hsp20/alpha crystallin family protein [Phenylobacterium sp.]|uniref:Hsp20/alpha crystallin family protein n=1 Tax=Phenylobacterium sp. TaxID=1871053 RepID=UPI0012195E8D|nr:Hsp20/alpha crystallin family protein [Phenylobacterium sp.]TAJ69834.1 MAG: Hsp20/alpha crystallin family protein [Phenylobacterium sp.]
MTVHRSPAQFLPKLAGSAGNVFAPIQREFDRLFDQLGNGWAALAEIDLSPRMDIRDTKDSLEISVELPGLARDDVKITVEDEVLTISGEKKTEREAKEEDYHFSERTYGAFSRSVTLPRSVEAAKIKATMKDGVLKVTAPKNGTAQTKSIEIQPAD